MRCQRFKGTVQQMKTKVDLTAVEYIILAGLSNGKTITEIAKDINYSRDWISKKSARLYKKLGAKNASHAVAIALKERLID